MLLPVGAEYHEVGVGRGGFSQGGSDASGAGHTVFTGTEHSQGGEAVPREDEPAAVEGVTLFLLADGTLRLYPLAVLGQSLLVDKIAQVQRHFCLAALRKGFHNQACFPEVSGLLRQ